MIDYRTIALYSKLKQFDYLVNKTSRFIDWALKNVSNPYVACSFGKDSAVLLHLVLSKIKDVPVRFVRWKGETEFIDNYDQVIAMWNLSNLTQIILQRNSINDTFKERFSVKEYDSYFIGLRIEESAKRRITLKTNGTFYKNSENLIRISPLAEWKTIDIAAYIYKYDLPTLSSYKIQGIESRTASRIPRADHGIREAFLVDLKNRDFQAYQNLLINFPEIKYYA